MEKAKVIFRKNKNGEVIAFFPEFHVQYGNIMSYMHIGQHSEGKFGFLLFHHKSKRTGI